MPIMTGSEPAELGGNPKSAVNTKGAATLAHPVTTATLAHKNDKDLLAHKK